MLNLLPGDYDPTLGRCKTVEIGDFERRKVTSGGKPLFIILIFLGVVGIGVAGVGVAVWGGHQGWWNVGCLTNLSQVQALVMMSAGGGGGILLLIPGIIGLVKASKAELNTLLGLQVKGGLGNWGASYDHAEESGIADLVYFSSQYGFGCVVDGVGHNNPKMREALKVHFEPFIENYKKGLKNIQTLEEISDYFERSVENLEQQFRDKNLAVNRQKVCLPTDTSAKYPDDPYLGTFLHETYMPSMSFVQVVQVPGQLLLLTAQAVDTMVVVEMPDGELLKTQPSSTGGIGDLQQAVQIATYNITGAKRVIGFSDGIGEFMTFDELKAVINATESCDLFNQLKAKVVSQPAEKSKKIAANESDLKPYDKENLKCSDDMSLFVLDLA